MQLSPLKKYPPGTWRFFIHFFKKAIYVVYGYWKACAKLSAGRILQAQSDASLRTGVRIDWDYFPARIATPHNSYVFENDQTIVVYG